MDISLDKLKELFEYQEDTGYFVSKVSRGKVKKGQIMLSKKNTGHIRIIISGKHYLAHRLAWFYVHGEWPKHDIDHIDHDPSNNRIENLRDVSRKENLRNASISKRNRSGVTGVTWSKQHSKWEAKIQGDGKRIFIGLFSNLDDAAKARKDAEISQGYHRNHGT